MVTRYTDEDVIHGLQEKKRSYINYLYKEFFPVVRSIVERNSGTLQDVEDVFQDTIFVLYRQSLSEKIDLHCSLKTYFYAISRNIWLQRLERKYRLLYKPDFEVNEEKARYGQDDSDILEYELERRRLFQQHFFAMPADCQELLRLFFIKTPLKQIASMMHYKNTNYVKTRKYLCKNMLRKKILNDPKCNPFINYEQL
ncbi:MAG: sigma-70 family RNA polymerase sigma factor [Bacteroidales bacterium]|nr:sigma-70 family RNA polymerase sigma factor [Bacteroidales bacterium]